MVKKTTDSNPFPIYQGSFSVETQNVDIRPSIPPAFGITFNNGVLRVESGEIMKCGNVKFKISAGSASFYIPLFAVRHVLDKEGKILWENKSPSKLN